MLNITISILCNSSLDITFANLDFVPREGDELWLTDRENILLRVLDVQWKLSLNGDHEITVWCGFADKDGQHLCKVARKCETCEAAEELTKVREQQP
jgi:hypothetical protein